LPVLKQSDLAPQPGIAPPPNITSSPAVAAVGQPSSVDVAQIHPYAFVFMLFLLLMFGIGRIASQTKANVRWQSFLHVWMFLYLVFLGVLMSVTTAMSLVLLVDKTGQPRVDLIPPSFISLAAAVLGVFGFEFLVRKFIIGFGETQFDVGASLQNIVDQTVAATLKKEAGR